MLEQFKNVRAILMKNNHKVTIHLAPEEYEPLQHEANQLSISIPKLVRHYALNQPLPNMTLHKVYWVLCQINENLQILIDLLDQNHAEVEPAVNVKELAEALEQVRATQRAIVGTQSLEHVNEAEDWDGWLDWDEI